MNGQSGRVILILLMVMLLACLPAQASRGGQQGGSSLGNDHGAQVNVSAGLSPAASTESAGQAPATDTGRSVLSQPVVQAGSGVTASDTAKDLASATGKSTQAVMGNTQSGTTSSSGTSADSPSRSSVSTNGRPDAMGGAGPSPMTGGENAAAGMPGNAGGMEFSQRTAGENNAGIPGMGSLQRSGGDSATGIPDVQGQNGAMVRMAGTVGSPSGIAVARFASFSGTGALPGPGAGGHGPFPQRQQRGPPAQSPAYPCGPAQAVPLPQASGQSRDESKDEGLPRQRSKRTGVLPQMPDPLAPDPESPSVPPQALFPLNMLLFGGFRRISKKNVLEHDARQVIYQAITATPGTDVKTLTEVTGINENTLRYHLDRLVATGKITSFARPGVVRYFQNQGAYTQFEHRVFHYLWTGTPRGILWLLQRNPGMTRQQLADALMIAGPSVTRQIDYLIEDGIVENRSPGRSNHYYLTAEAAQAIDKVMRQAQAMQKEHEALPMAVSAG